MNFAITFFNPNAPGIDEMVFMRVFVEFRHRNFEVAVPCVGRLVFIDFDLEIVCEGEEGGDMLELGGALRNRKSVD